MKTKFHVYASITKKYRTEKLILRKIVSEYLYVLPTRRDLCLKNITSVDEVKNMRKAFK